MSPPHDGRQPRRRDDDPDDAIVKGWAVWMQLMFLHRAKGIALVALLTWLMTTLGFRYIGPAEILHDEIKAVVMRVDTLAAQVDDIEKRVTAAGTEREAIRQRLDWVIYLQCVSVRRTDPNALPSICDEAGRK